MRRIPAVIVVLLFTAIPASLQAGDRVPAEHWMKYTNPHEAGFDPVKLEAARKVWEKLPSSAFIVVADGAVVAAWGETNRRFMCHSVRKSFLSALYGIYWDRGEIELNKTLFDLGIDETPDPLLDSERSARILDLLKARSGVFHPAAYAGRTDSAPRGSKGAGRYFAYNNWDFNTLATILMQETGDDVFEAFDEFFGQPLGMEDWRVSDGYYHYERDKSRYPAYPFRLSARDAARFGLLFTREGSWGDQRILSKQWVRRSSALYSIDDATRGYGLMWWIYREPRFERHGMYAALGVGNQMIAALPDSDLVIVNRANTYDGERTPDTDLNNLIEQVLEARVGKPVAQPKLEPLESLPEPGVTTVDYERAKEFVGKWDYPPKPLGLPAQSWVRISNGDGHLVAHSPTSGTFRLYPQPDGTFQEEDSHERYVQVRDEAGAFAGVSAADLIVNAAINARADGNVKRSSELMTLAADEDGISVASGQAILNLLDGKTERAEKALRDLAQQGNAGRVEGSVNGAGYGFLGSGKTELARDVLMLNTRLFPESSNAWDSLGEVNMALGRLDEAVGNYEKSLALNADNANAAAMLTKIREKESAAE